MTRTLLPTAEHLRAVCLALQQRAEPLYLVGGYVRDWLLGRESHDLDFAVQGAAIPLARQVANRLGASFMILDSEHDTARILLRHDGETDHVDFARLRGEDILADLAARDFTINAVAVDLKHLEESDPPLLDPLRGQRDIRTRSLRAASEHAFQDDPLRMLRGVRQAATLGFTIVPETEALIRRDAPLLVRAAQERMRDELARLLACPGAEQQVRYLDQLGLLAPVLPELSPPSPACSGHGA